MRAVRGAWLAVGLALAGGVAAQTPRQHEFSLPTGFELDSNPALAVGGGSSIWVWRANPRYAFTQQQGSASWLLSAAVSLERSSNRQLRNDRQDPSLSLSYRDETPRAGWSVDVSAAQASTRATELESTGLLTLDRTQTTYALGVSGRQALSERWSLSGGASLRDVRYDTLALVENETTSANASLGYSLSEGETVALQASASHYEPGRGGLPGQARASDSTGLTVSYSQVVSPSLEWGTRLGLVRITGANADTSWQGGASLTHTGQRLNASLDAGRTVASSGLLGGFAATDSIRASASYAISERTRLGASLGYTRSARSAQSRDASTVVGVTATTELSPFWQVAFSLQERRAERAAGTAQARLAAVNLIYTHPDW